MELFGYMIKSINKREKTDIHSITAEDNILNLGEKTKYCYYYAFSGVFCNFIDLLDKPIVIKRKERKIKL